MKKLLLLAAFGLFAAPAFAQTAIVTQVGGTQTATVVQTGSSSNEAYVDQLTDNGGQNTADVSQNGVSNYASVYQRETGTGGNTPGTFATLQQTGDYNDMWQTATAPGYNSGQTVNATQSGDRNRGVQSITSGYNEVLTLVQSGDRNDSEQRSTGAYAYGDVFQTGDDNIARQTMSGTNNGSGSDVVLIDQFGDDNQAYQSVSGGGFSQNNNAEIDQNGDDNYASQTGHGNDMYLRIRQDGNSNWAYSNSDGDKNYLNVRMSHDAYFYGTQTGASNEVMGLGGIGTEATVLNASSLTVSQVGDFNDALVRMQTGGSAVVSQSGNTNITTVDQH